MSERISPFPPFSDKICYYLNSGAMGDMIAVSAVLNYAIKTYHEPRNQDYRIASSSAFDCIFPFVTPDKFISFDDAFKLENYSIRKLNRQTALDLRGSVASIEPVHLHSIHNASINLLNRVISISDAPYVPLNSVNVDNFDIDFSKSVIINVTYQDNYRCMNSEEIYKIAKYIISVGLIPIYVGKTGKMPYSADQTIFHTNFEYPGYGINLIDKTSIPELASIISKSKAIIGVDSGVMHLAMTTDVPVICGFTTINPNIRIPHRASATISIISEEVACRFCQSDWNISSFGKCPRNLKNPECVELMTSEKFIHALKIIGIK